MAIRASTVAQMSRIYRTPAFPDPTEPNFANAAFAIDWAESAAELLALLHSIEAEFGRIRSQRWQARSLDLDLIALDQCVLPDAATQTAWRDLSQSQAANTAPDELILPHPRLQERGFVLVPLMDIAPDWRHPVLGKTISEMHAALSPAEVAEITPW